MREENPDKRRSKARNRAAWFNAALRKPYANVSVAVELTAQACAAHGLPFERSRSEMASYSNRFMWTCDEAGDLRDCLKVRDNQTGRTVTWPNF